MGPGSALPRATASAISTGVGQPRAELPFCAVAWSRTGLSLTRRVKGGANLSRFRQLAFGLQPSGYFNQVDRLRLSDEDDLLKSFLVPQ